MGWPCSYTLANQDNTVVKIGNEVELPYYRLRCVASGSIDLRVGEPEAVYGSTDVGTGKANNLMNARRELWFLAF